MRAQREALGWSIEQAAEQLKLAPRQVTALEEGDYASLPNPAVVRGFIRAYAKILKIDAAPLVATIDIAPAGTPEVMPVRALSTAFSESRFPSMTQRSQKKTPWIVGAVVLVAIAIGGAVELGYISPSALMHAGRDAVASAPGDKAADKPADAAAPAPAMADAASTPTQPVAEGGLQSPSVPLISVPGENAGAAANNNAATPATAATAPATPEAAAPAKAADKPAEKGAQAAGANPLVLTVRQDSWIEIRRKQGSPLISRIVLAGSTETFDISEPVLLVVGKPSGVDATLRGAAVALNPVPNGTIARVNLK
jgi:cytoskeleton protein RodZ